MQLGRAYISVRGESRRCLVHSQLRRPDSARQGGTEGIARACVSGHAMHRPGKARSSTSSIVFQGTVGQGPRNTSTLAGINPSRATVDDGSTVLEHYRLLAGHGIAAEHSSERLKGPTTPIARSTAHKPPSAQLFDECHATRTPPQPRLLTGRYGRLFPASPNITRGGPIAAARSLDLQRATKPRLAPPPLWLVQRPGACIGKPTSKPPLYFLLDDRCSLCALLRIVVPSNEQPVTRKTRRSSLAAHVSTTRQRLCAKDDRGSLVIACPVFTPPHRQPLHACPDCTCSPISPAISDIASYPAARKIIEPHLPPQYRF